MTQRATTAIAITLTAAALSGCSDTHDVGQLPGAEGVKEVPPALGTAIAGGDGQVACSLMSVDAQKHLKAKTRAKDCLDAVALAASTLADSDKTWLRTMTVHNIKITGATATGRIAGPSAVPAAVQKLFGSDTMAFRTEAERWELDQIS